MTDDLARDRSDDARWFHAQIDPIVGAELVADGWAAIAERVGDAAEAPAPQSAAHRPRWVAAAAVLVALASAAAILAVTRADDSTSVTTDDPPATGLYVPESLPDGWHLRTAWVAKVPTACSVESRQWQGDTDGGATARLEVTYTPCELSDDAPPGQPWARFGPGVEDPELVELEPERGVRLLRWQDDGTWTLRSEGGLTVEQLTQAAQRIVAEPTSAAGPLAGFELTGSNLGEARPGGPTVTVSLVAPDDSTVSYRLNAPGEGPRPSPFSVDTPIEVEGQTQRVVQRSLSWDGVSDPERLDRCCRRASSYVGAWSGADVQVPRTLPVSDDPLAAPTDGGDGDARDALLLELVGHLRPATAEEWRAFLATADDQPAKRLLGADALADLTGPSHAGATATTQAGSDTTTTTPTRPQGEPVTSEPGTVTPREEREAMYSSLDGLEIRLELPTTMIAVGNPVTGTLVIRNTTDDDLDLNECTWGLMQWGLGEIGSDEPPGRSIDDCFDDPIVTIPAGETVRRALDARPDPGFYAQRADQRFPWSWLGTLPGGEYEAIVTIPGDRETVRIELPVTVPEPPCSTSDELAREYLQVSAGDAERHAEEAGLAYRVVSSDGERPVLTADLRCDRINVELRGSAVTNAFLG